MNDIGVVEYSKDTINNRILAKWFYLKEDKNVNGTGIAIGELGKDFSGHFHVTYYNQNGVELSKYALEIVSKQSYYLLKWLSEGQIKFIGIGIEKEDKLYAGWKSFQDN